MFSSYEIFSIISAIYDTYNAFLAMACKMLIPGIEGL